MPEFVGFWTPTYKDLNKFWEEIKFAFHSAIKDKNEQLKSLKFINGSEVDFWSMDSPGSGRGRKYHVAIMDECEKAGKFRQAWEGAISPTLIDYNGSAWMLSTPQFGDTYFKEIHENSTRLDDWASWTYTSYDNPKLPEGAVDAMRLTMDDATFRCEILAEDVDHTINPFLWNWSDKFISDKAQYRPGNHVYLSIDFNVDPFAAILAHVYSDGYRCKVSVFDEITVPNGNMTLMAQEVRARVDTSFMWIIGDSNGNNKNIGELGAYTQYEILMNLLNLGGKQKRVKANPKHIKSRSDCTYFLANLELEINPKCKNLIRDFNTVQWNSDKQQIIKKERRKESERADHMDCFRYLIDCDQVQDVLKVIRKLKRI